MNDGDDKTANHELIHVSFPLLLVSMAPLLLLGFVSHRLGFGLEQPMLVGASRTFVQLSILGAILHPLFRYGEKQWWLVVLYGLFMILLAAMEATNRSKYYFRGLFGCILVAFLTTIVVVSGFAFGVILRPSPLWDPQYVIPVSTKSCSLCLCIWCSNHRCSTLFSIPSSPTRRLSVCFLETASVVCR